MKTSIAYIPRRQRGMALVASLLLLVVITILGVTMFRSYGLTERVAGNTRDRERAVNAAMSAQAYAEFYLNGNKGANSAQNQDCSKLGSAVTASMSAIMVCTNALTNVTQVPWANSYTYTPPGMTVASGSVGAYSQAPQFYITFLGASNGSNQSYNAQSGQNSSVFQIDAVAWGGAGNTVAVVESGYKVMTAYSPTDPSSTGQAIRSYSLSNP
jgi:type IV pilus assembly protein PilX